MTTQTQPRPLPVLPVLPLRCQHPSCRKPAKLSCQSCHLVAYCSAPCRTKDWGNHKSACTYRLAQENWEPEYSFNGEEPSWVSRKRPEEKRPYGGVLGTGCHLWGRMPAIDVLKLSENEGRGWRKDVRMLWVKADDLGDVMRTVVGLETEGESEGAAGGQEGKSGRRRAKSERQKKIARRERREKKARKAEDDHQEEEAEGLDGEEGDAVNKEKGGIEKEPKDEKEGEQDEPSKKPTTDNTTTDGDGASEQQEQQFDFVVNNPEPIVTIRNVLLLLLALAMREKNKPAEEIADTVLHLWYSAFVSATHIFRLKEHVGPLVEEVIAQIGPSRRGPGRLVSHQWSFGPNLSVKVTLAKLQWEEMSSILAEALQLDADTASAARRATTGDLEREDDRQQWFFNDETRQTRLAKLRFKTFGLLLPFGHDRDGFDQANPLLSLNGAATWMMNQLADPLDGWSIFEVKETPWIPGRDIYGKLYCYLQKFVQKFLARLGGLCVEFSFRACGVKELQQFCNKDTFDRIHASDRTDDCNEGTRTTMLSLAPLLATPVHNAHATILSLYLSAVDKEFCEGEDVDLKKLRKILRPVTDENNRLIGAQFYLEQKARSWFADADGPFNSYAASHLQVDDLGVRMKPSNTIVEPWPLRRTAVPENVQSQKDITTLVGSNATGTERYVEWQRVEKDFPRKDKTKGSDDADASKKSGSSAKEDESKDVPNSGATKVERYAVEGGNK